MMASCSETEDQFFDTRDDVSFVSDLSSQCSESFLSSGHGDCALGYEFWTKEPISVDERRRQFLKWIGLNSQYDSYDKDMETDTGRLRDNEEAVLANLDSKPQSFSSHSLQHFQSNDATYLLEDGTVEENLNWKIKNLDDGTGFVTDELVDDVSVTTLSDVGSDKMISFDEFMKTLSSSSLVQQLFRKDCKGFNIVDLKKKVRNAWLERFSAMTHILDRTKGFLRKPENNRCTGSATRRLRVNVCKKQSKELSSLYTGQEFPAHDGSILTMKFSPDGQYLASAGVDGLVRIWKVLEDDSTIKRFSSEDIDPSCLYFSMNHFSKIVPPDAGREMDDRMKSVKKSSDSACVVLPPKGFQLSEEPLHDFHGHKGEVLALSWSKNGHLLSSSVDKTARLWRVGHDHCLGVYSHNNYVTCIEFNPVDDNYFITGSIDGKLRIWEVQDGRVVDWTDIKEIVTAVCYSPDGKGGVIGSMDGNCRFYDIIDNRLELGASINLKGKKKLPGKRITGFQYCPNDSSKVMVTCADSQVQILCGTNIICKFKGNRNSASQGAAAFTSDGEHIVSATDDSNIRIWNYTSQSRSKKVWSCESFLSRNTSIAVPWCGWKNKLGALPGSILRNGHFDEKILQMLPASFPDCFATSLGFFLDALYKGSATWPEEKLPKSNPMAAKPSVCKSEFKFLKNAWLNAFNSPNLWGLVIVTAGWDGCIRTFLNYGLPIRF